MLQAAISDGHALDPVALSEDSCGAVEADVSRRHIVEALVVAGLIVVADEGRDLPRLSSPASKLKMSAKTL